MTLFHHAAGLLILTAGLAAYAAGPTAPLAVSENKRFLVYEDGSPFFYLGDTAWELFHRLNREEAELYLTNRTAKGFDAGSKILNLRPYSHRFPLL